MVLNIMFVFDREQKEGNDRARSWFSADAEASKCYVDTILVGFQTSFSGQVKVAKTGLSFLAAHLTTCCGNSSGPLKLLGTFSVAIW